MHAYAHGFVPHKTPGEETWMCAVPECTHEVTADGHHSKEYENEVTRRLPMEEQLQWIS